MYLCVRETKRGNPTPASVQIKQISPLCPFLCKQSDYETPNKVSVEIVTLFIVEVCFSEGKFHCRNIVIRIERILYKKQNCKFIKSY